MFGKSFRSDELSHIVSFLVPTNEILGSDKLPHVVCFLVLTHGLSLGFKGRNSFFFLAKETGSIDLTSMILLYMCSYHFPPSTNGWENFSCPMLYSLIVRKSFRSDELSHVVSFLVPTHGWKVSDWKSCPMYAF